MGERAQLVKLVRDGVPVVEVAAMFGVSRKTAHKWLERADRLGEEGLVDVSRARHHLERFEGPEADALVALRRKRPTWGPRKLLDALKAKDPTAAWPAISTAGELLKRIGLVAPRQRRAPPGIAPYKVSDTQPTKPNDRWTVDFKGEFRLGDGQLCFPFTLRDAISRMMLDINALPVIRGVDVVRRFEWAFREYGLPDEIHSDTGKPFASTGLARLSWVTVYLLKLYIRPVFSRPAKPQDNGGHERMHRDLKAETARPPAANMQAQQHRFDSFRTYFNTERPHEALAGGMPASSWTASPRPYPSKIAEPEYPAHWEVRVPNTEGKISWKGKPVMVTSALKHQRIGLEPVDDGVWRVHFTTLAIGLFDERLIERKVLGLRPHEATQLAPTKAAPCT